MTPTAEERYEAAFNGAQDEWRRRTIAGDKTTPKLMELFAEMMTAALRQAYEDGKRDEREACAVEIEQLATAQGNAECCGFGVGSPPECCADPVYMISGSLAATAIRARTQSEPSK